MPLTEAALFGMLENERECADVLEGILTGIGWQISYVEGQVLRCDAPAGQRSVITTLDPRAEDRVLLGRVQAIMDRPNRSLIERFGHEVTRLRKLAGILVEVGWQVEHDEGGPDVWLVDNTGSLGWATTGRLGDALQIAADDGHCLPEQVIELGVVKIAICRVCGCTERERCAGGRVWVTPTQSVIQRLPICSRCAQTLPD